MILQHLPREHVLLEGTARDKRGVLKELTHLFAPASEGGLAEQILDGLVEREEVMSTGIGHGIAIPHARVKDVSELRLALVRYPNGIDFAAFDGKPVYLAFGVVGPPSGTEHVKLLASIARLVKTAGAIDELLHAETMDAIYDVLGSHAG